MGQSLENRRKSTRQGYLRLVGIRQIPLFSSD